MNQQQIKEYGITLPAKGCVFVRLLKHNKTVPCVVLKVSKVNSTVQIKGVEMKVPNDDVDIDMFGDDDE